MVESRWRKGARGARAAMVCYVYVCCVRRYDLIWRVAEMAGGEVYGSIRRYTYVRSLVDLY